ncbi:MAG: hypothetical protein V1725_02570 [archaeon]
MAEQLYKVETRRSYDDPNERHLVLGYAFGDPQDIREYYLPKRQSDSDHLEVIPVETIRVTPQMAKETRALERIITDAQARLQER